MSWKPARGHGICFSNALEREMKLWIKLQEAQYHPLPFMEYSKLYYYWLVAERNRQKYTTPSKAQPIEEIYGQGIPASTLRSLEQHRDMCYKRLQKLMPA